MNKKDSLIHDAHFLAQKASALRLASRTIADGLRTGNFRSMYRGRGVDFAGVREYLHGDDVRAIDWNVTARMGKPFIKLFEEDRELIIFLVVDRSASMESGTGKNTRLKTATETAALLLLAALHNSLPVGGVLFDGETGFSTIPKSSKNHAMLFFSKLDARPICTKAGSALPQALRGATKLLKNRSLVMLISDFRCAGYEAELARLSAKHDVVAVCITDESDTKLPHIGSLNFCDSESGHEMTLPTSSAVFERDWKNYNLRRMERWQTLCAKRGVTTLVVSTDQDPAQELIKFFSTRRQ